MRSAIDRMPRFVAIVDDDLTSRSVAVVERASIGRETDAIGKAHIFVELRRLALGGNEIEFSGFAGPSVVKGLARMETRE